MNNDTAIIQPLSTEQQQQVIEQTHAYIQQAAELFNIKKETVDISFNLKGRAAGMYRVKRRSNLLFGRAKREIRYNPYIFSKYFEDNFITTIPHEVAHYISDMIYGIKNIKPHGSEWKAIMRIFGADASVTASYDLAGIPLRKHAYFTYQCACKEHQLTSIRHNRIKKYRYQYLCIHCKQVLQQKPK
ncbi:MAG: SprT-like domain-containing protein [Gammaproteobacteria bacterium]|nr:SprT-like domain-containing protein [Gammaproteobacteria bacterium]